MRDEIREWGTNKDHKYIVKWTEWDSEVDCSHMEKGFIDKFKAQQWCDLLNESGMSPTLVTI